MSSYAVARGRGLRVQLGVIDLTGQDVPEAIRAERPRFFVRVISDGADRYCAFSTGRQVYWGTDPDAAWNAAANLVGAHAMFRQVPRRFQRYLLKWSKQ